MKRAVDFFLVGAPKSGTTAFARYLAGNPGIFVTTPKEPYFFCEDMPGLRRVYTFREYERLFREAPEEAIIGEASVWYMYSRVALEKIRKLYPAAKILAMIRRPDEMVHSLQRYLHYRTTEDQEDLRNAWTLEFARRNGRCIPKSCPDPSILYYRHVARYGEQIRRILQSFPREQIHVILFDDFVKTPRIIYEETLHFLGVENDARDRFPIINSHKEARSRIAQKMLRQSLTTMRASRLAIKRYTSIDLSRVSVHRPIVRALVGLNTRSLKRPRLDLQLRREILAAYSDDIMTLQDILHRDLSTWLTFEEEIL